MYYYNTFIWY